MEGVRGVVSGSDHVSDSERVVRKRMLLHILPALSLRNILNIDYRVVHIRLCGFSPEVIPRRVG